MFATEHKAPPVVSLPRVSAFAEHLGAPCRARAQILARHGRRHAELQCRMPGPARVPEKAARKRHHVGPAFGDDVLGLPRLGNHPDRGGDDARVFADALGEGHLITGPTGITWFFISPPLEQSIQSQPSLFNSRANTTVCERSHPPSIQSVHETRTPSGLCSGHAARTAAKTSSGKRILLASEPPYSSSRRFESGDRNSCMR